MELDLTPDEARGLLRMLLLGLRAHVRDGGTVPSWATSRCQELANLADTPAPTFVGAAGGTAPSSVDAMTTASWVAVPEAAGLVGVSETYVRRLARTGRVRRVKVGRDWQVDVDSLRSVLRRTA